VYRYPAYYDLGYRWSTEAECDFVVACLRAHGPPQAKRLLDIGCGSGRHLMGLARRGFRMTGIDASAEMVAFASAQAAAARLPITVSVGELGDLRVEGPFDAAYCFMDTFRFLLTTEDILGHLRAVAERLAPGGLYLTDFWIPREWGQIGQEVHQWEQTEGTTMVRVFYLQDPESIDPIAQTFEDELLFEVQENGRTTTIRGGPTRTRLIMPREFDALVRASGAFELLSTHGDFDLTQPLVRESLSWRMVSVMRKRA
jgi:SAM-dependent methyltransferase